MIRAGHTAGQQQQGEGGGYANGYHRLILDCNQGVERKSRPSRPIAVRPMPQLRRDSQIAAQIFC
ncbi:unnamed protein product [Ciceribacter sp. T2.26MG-112.2]|nr:unnamed protein product [Ciceribacter naphthalenivorans]